MKGSFKGSVFELVEKKFRSDCTWHVYFLLYVSIYLTFSYLLYELNAVNGISITMSIFFYEHTFVLMHICFLSSHLQEDASPS